MIAGRGWNVTCLSVGNPHAVVFVENVDALNLAAIGPEFEKHTLFPERVNTEFAQIIDNETIKMRVWERGSGETLACGTGATATLAAACTCGLTGPRAKLQLLGGELLIEWDREENLLYMTGPAEYVFEGQLL
jgi:diaminopimelate epimerase